MHDVIQNWPIRIRCENNAPCDLWLKLGWKKLSLIEDMYGRFVLSPHFLLVCSNEILLVLQKRGGQKHHPTKPKGRIILREIFSVASVVSDVIGRQNAEREVAGSNPGSVNQHSMSLTGFCGSVLVQTILKLLVDNFNYAELYLWTSEGRYCLSSKRENKPRLLIYCNPLPSWESAAKDTC